jgi:dUTP pyrophosphatase
MAIPTGYYARVAPRSGLAVKNFIDVGAGVIDEDYRGDVKVLLFNFGETDFEVKIGDRIAQLLIEKILHAQIAEVNEKQLTSTVRGSGGFGSTGV